MRADPPRPTAIARLIATIARDGVAGHPLCGGEGWWRRDIRLLHPPAVRPADAQGRPSARLTVRASAPPVLITGASGTLGRAFAASCERRGLDYVLTDRRQLCLGDPASMLARLRDRRPWAVINTAGFVRVDEAEADPAPCLAANATGAIELARMCVDRGIPIVSFSSDLVFDGSAGRPLVESDPTSPICVYGRSKAALEQGLQAMGSGTLIIRTAAFFSSRDPFNFAHEVVRRLSNGDSIAAAEDLIVSPTHVPDLVDAVLDLLIDGEAGIWHVANAGEASWAGFAGQIADACRLDRRKVRPVPWRTLGLRAPRPRYVALGTQRTALLPPLAESVALFAREMAEA